MKLLDKVKFSFGKWALKSLTRGYSEVVGMGGDMSDWIMSGITDDADLQSNWYRLVQYSRDLFKLNPYMRKFVTDIITNVFGSEGITLQMKIKEETDRVVYAAEEKSWLAAKQRSNDEWCERGKRVNVPFPKRQYLTLDGEPANLRGYGLNGNSKAKATVKAGQPDVFSNNLIERAWKEWQKRQNCTAGKRHTYAQTREHRLVMCARDGDCFIRHIRGFNNKFGYAIEIIPAEFVDHSINQVLENGNHIKMGIEYSPWGEAVAYYILKKRPNDWRYFSLSGLSGHGGKENCDRIESVDIIHYCRFEDARHGRGAPWAASVMAKLRHIDKYAEAELITARADACSGGHYEATMAGVDPGELADYISRVERGSERLTQVVKPAMWKALPFGWKANDHNSTHPNQNFPAFKKENLREICAGIGDQYNVLAGDLEGVNYSSMRAGSLDIREWWMMRQQFDIDIAEVPIFEAWLEMSLQKGAIALPLTNFEKFNRPTFQGRRWPWVDPLKDAKADQFAIDSMLTSRTRICNENGSDFEEIVEEQAMEKILIEEAGLNVSNAATPVTPNSLDPNPADDPVATNAANKTLDAAIESGDEEKIDAALLAMPVKSRLTRLRI